MVENAAQVYSAFSDRITVPSIKFITGKEPVSDPKFINHGMKNMMFTTHGRFVEQSHTIKLLDESKLDGFSSDDDDEDAYHPIGDLSSDDELRNLLWNKSRAPSDEVNMYLIEHTIRLNNVLWNEGALPVIGTSKYIQFLLNHSIELNPSDFFREPDWFLLYGFWKYLPRNIDYMKSSPRYFKGRRQI